MRVCVHVRPLCSVELRGSVHRNKRPSSGHGLLPGVLHCMQHSSCFTRGFDLLESYSSRTRPSFSSLSMAQQPVHGMGALQWAHSCPAAVRACRAATRARHLAAAAGLRRMQGRNLPRLDAGQVLQLAAC